jgi:hypothetical protein
VIRGIAEQCSDTWKETDFTPLPCAHPNAHSLSYAYRGGAAVVPIARFIDVTEHLDLLSGAITFTRARARELVGQLISRQCCSDGGCGTEPVAEFARIQPSSTSSKFDLPVIPPSQHTHQPQRNPEIEAVASEFFKRILAEDVSPADVFRITTTSFMDAYNFDVRQAMKDCVHFVLPSGHIIPFSAYNLLYRPGLVPLPQLRKTFATEDAESTENSLLEIEN